MDIYNYLKKDHYKVSLLFKKIITAQDVAVREKLFFEVKKELELHADPEDKTFYQEIRKNKQGKEEAEHGAKEHENIKKALAKLSRISAGNEAAWLVQLGELKYIVEHHVKEEENDMFKIGKKIISVKRANELSAEMDALKNKMQASQKFKNKFPQQ